MDKQNDKKINTEKIIKRYGEISRKVLEEAERYKKEHNQTDCKEK